MLCMISIWFADSSLDDLIQEIINANNRGVSIEKNGSAVASWSFGQSFFFSSTVVTTIGMWRNFNFYFSQPLNNPLMHFVFSQSKLYNHLLEKPLPLDWWRFLWMARPSLKIGSPVTCTVIVSSKITSNFKIHENFSNQVILDFPKLQDMGIKHHCHRKGKHFV